MHEFDQIDDHMLGAFVDGELDTASCELILEAMDKDHRIRERVYKLRRVKDLMNLGFKTVQAPKGSRNEFSKRTLLPRRRTWLTRWSGVAASLMLLVGLGAGYVGYHIGAQLAGESTLTVASAEQQQEDRVLLHISESDPQQFAAALDYTRKFLEEHQSRGGQIAVVANAGGLDLLRAGVSPFEKQIIEMIRDYPNVHFIACANSIRKLRKNAMEPVIIANVDSTLPAMDKIIQHVQQGYTYIKVKSLMEI